MTADKQTPAVIIDERGPALWATINRPKALNAINEEVLDGLEAALDKAEKNFGIRALCITGLESAFSVGLDIECLDRGFRDHEYFRNLLNRFNDYLARIEQSEIPVIAAVNGLTRAGGFELLLACDLSIAANEAQIGDNHLEFGVIPGGGATQRAPRRLGMQQAKELIFTARWLDGAEATALGLVARNVPREDLTSSVELLISSIATKNRYAIAATKRAMHDGAELPLKKGVEFETAVFFEYLDSHEEASEGFKRYWIKRQRRRATQDTGSNTK